MKHLTASTSPSPFSGENWFDPLEDAIRFRVRAFIEAVVAEEAQAALGGRARYQRSGAPKGYRNGHRHRQLVGTFGALTVSLPRVRLLDGDGGEKEWRSQTIQAYKRLTKRAEAIIANTYLAGTNTRRVRRALAGLFGGKVGKDAVSRAWRKVKTDWESWQARDLSGEDIVRLILDGTGVKARLDGRVLSIPLLVVLGVRRDGQKVLLAVKNMGGETEAAWRHVLEELLGRGLKAPELLIVDGGKGLEAALASLWSDIPVQRCTVHKERNLLAHAPKALHDEVKADYTDMMYAENAEQVRKKRKAYLPFHGVIGKGLRHVAVHGETWLALIGWQPGAFKLAARDRWIGWPAEQQFRRLHLIANNSRFVILTPGRVHNLASRVLGLSLRRLSQDIQAVHGYPVFLAETFVDVSRFVGTCYRASNWRSLGLTRGFAREPGGSARWRHHGQPKEIFVFELTDAAAEALSRTEVPAHWNAEQHTGPMAAPRLRSLFECLGEVPECRRDRGKRYPLNTVLAIAVAARLAGYRGVNAFAQFAALLSQEQLEAVGAFWSPSKQRYTAPAITTFHNILAALPPETLDNAIGQWTGQHSTAHAPVAMDGKDLRGASKQTEDGRRMMVAAVEHDSGMVLGPVEVDSKSNEIPAVRELSSSLDLAGRIVTVDAMHAQHETARCLLGRRADYVISAIKDNQETILEDLKAIDFSDAPWHETVDKGHGRIERRRCAAVDLSGAEWDGYANLHGRRQTMRIEREREILKTGKRSIEVTWSLTSLGTDRAGPEELLALVRNHWHIENRLHYVRDFTYDEDRCRAYVRHLPRNLACLTNVAIAIVRCSGRFRYLPEANRHYAARAQDALDAILIAPTA